ncbi:MAG: hypothetical protein KDD99_13965 [Bacteroidetes bacterium]|nr:hypothetical protein [Bacteroidota bacterium]
MSNQIPGWEVNMPANGDTSIENYPLPGKNELIERIDLVSDKPEQNLLFVNRIFKWSETGLSVRSGQNPQINFFPDDMTAYWIYEISLESLAEERKILDWIIWLLTCLIPWNPLAEEMSLRFRSTMDKKEVLNFPVYIEYPFEGKQRSIYAASYPHPSGSMLVGLTLAQTKE